MSKINLNDIHKWMDYSLNTDDMKHGIPDAKFILYSNVHKYKSIDDLIGKTNKCYILYLIQSESYGHYVCLFKKDNKLFFQNSYALKPDDDLLFVKRGIGLEKKTYEDEPYLFELIAKSGYPCDYNPYPIQNDTAKTCGRHCIFRLWNTHLDSDQYYKLLKKKAHEKKITIDELVTYYTHKAIGV